MFPLTSTNSKLTPKQSCGVLSPNFLSLVQILGIYQFSTKTKLSLTVKRYKLHFSSIMASLLNPSLSLHMNKANDVNVRALSAKPLSKRECMLFGRTNVRNEQSCTMKVKSSLEADVMVKDSDAAEDKNDFGVVGVHHVGILCENLERSLHFYQDILGLTINEARPHDKLPYRGAWLWVGSEMIHLMELPNPDPYTGRPEHGGRDRHACIAIRNVSKLKDILDKAGIPYTLSRSGRPAIFTRDPDTNALEFTQVD